MSSRKVSTSGLNDLGTFRERLIDANRGRHLFLVRFQKIKGINSSDFVEQIGDLFSHLKQIEEILFGFFTIDSVDCLMVGISCPSGNPPDNIDGMIGTFHAETLRNNNATFEFGIARTQCNWISDADEIFHELLHASLRNLNDNLVRWSWTYFNRANAYFSDFTQDAVIQPTVHYNPKTETISVKGGEVFVGGTNYPSYYDLIDHIPSNIDRNRAEILILEKLILSCAEAPGLLKFNISPQSLIDAFDHEGKVDRLIKLIELAGLEVGNVRIELVEKPYDEDLLPLREICLFFWNRGVSFAADDFGVKSQSHQVVLDLGEMIKEFKLDPISFKFKPEEDQTKFLDNLAFIDYCKRLADNREAIITAEAVEDLDTLFFLIEHQVYHYQTFLFSHKIPIVKYIELFDKMQDIPLAPVVEFLRTPGNLEAVQECGTVFELLEPNRL